MAKETRLITAYGIKKTNYEQNKYYKIVVGIECDEEDNERGLMGFQFAEVKAEESAFNSIAEISQFPCKCEVIMSVTFAKDSQGNMVPRERIREAKVLDAKTVITPKKTAA